MQIGRCVGKTSLCGGIAERGDPVVWFCGRGLLKKGRPARGGALERHSGGVSGRWSRGGTSAGVRLCSVSAGRKAARWRQVAIPRVKGRVWIGVPVRARQAFATAGASGGTPGSPTPVGSALEAMISTAISGISFMRREV